MPTLSKPSPVAMLWVVTAILVAVAAVLLTVVVNRPSPTAAPPASSTTAAPNAGTPISQGGLSRLLPAGYLAGSCSATSPPPAGAEAAMTCGQNTDAGGPASASYILAQDGAALRAALGAVISGSTQVVCPGNIQSPGPWRRNANPTVPAGTLYCGTTAGQAVLAWTTDSDLLLSVTRGDVASMADLYRWWASHS